MRGDNMNRYLLNEKGSALIAVMVIVVIFMSITIAALVVVMQMTRLSAVERRRTQAFAVAEAGLEKATWLIERQAIDDDEFVNNKYTFTGTNEQGNYSVTIAKDEDNPYHYVVTATGTFTIPNEKASHKSQVKKVAQDLYYLSMEKSVFSYGSVNGGGSVTGNVKLRGPMYSGGDFTVGGTTSVKNPVGSTGNPVLIRGDLNIESGSVKIGGNTAQVGEESPMAVFVKGTINRPDQVFTLESKQVPLITLPPVVPSRYLDAAEANDFAVFNGNVDLSSSNVRFGQRSDGSYTFDYNGSNGRLTIEGVVYIDGNFTVSRNVTYYHPSGFTQATIFANGKITIGDDIISAVGDDPNNPNALDYPITSMLSLINPDVANQTEDFTIQFSSSPQVYAFLYSGGTIKIYRQISIWGTVIANNIIFEQVPSIFVPTNIGDNYPELFPGKEIAFVATSNWREIE